MDCSKGSEPRVPDSELPELKRRGGAKPLETNCLWASNSLEVNHTRWGEKILPASTPPFLESPLLAFPLRGPRPLAPTAP